MHRILTGLEFHNIKNNNFVCLRFWARKYDQKKRIKKNKNNTIENLLPYSKNWLSTYGDFLKSNV